VYYHDLAVQILGDSRPRRVPVGFSRQIALPILGRSFFAHFKSVAFLEPNELVEIKE
jgi:hypothetical protein